MRFEFTEQPTGDYVVTDASYVPTTWNVYHPGHPIRIVRVDRALAAHRGDRSRLLEAQREIRAAVNGLGATPGLDER